MRGVWRSSIRTRHASWVAEGAKIGFSAAVNTMQSRTCLEYLHIRGNLLDDLDQAHLKGLLGAYPQQTTNFLNSVRLDGVAQSGFIRTVALPAITSGFLGAI
jgi:hypothetical protein